MKKILILLISIFFLVFFYVQYRHFYTVGNMTFTFWKRIGGKCYITPYSYFGITSPKENYIVANSLGSIYIYIDSDSTLLIYNGDGNYKDIECNFTTYKYEYYDVHSSINDIDAYNQLYDTKLKYLPCIAISIREMYNLTADDN